jgi:hypothetical protein
MLNSTPRRSAQFVGPSVVHPSGRATHVEVPAVEMRTRTSCAGVPTWIVNDDHGPSFPSLKLTSEIQ